MKIHGLSDATAYVKKHSIIHVNHRHEGFVRSLVYKMEAMGEAEVIPRKDWTEFYLKQTIWSKRHPYLYASKIGAIGLLFSITAGATIAIVGSLLKGKDNNKQIQEVHGKFKAVHDSLVNIRNDLQKVQDTLAIYKQ